MDLRQEMITKTINFDLASSVRFYNHIYVVTNVLFTNVVYVAFYVVYVGCICIILVLRTRTTHREKFVKRIYISCIF
jgi:hypothetical protein